jgi:hypothetical protein
MGTDSVEWDTTLSLHNTLNPHDQIFLLTPVHENSLLYWEPHKFMKIIFAKQLES